MTSDGFELRVTLTDGSVTPIVVRYTAPLRSPAELRKLAVHMHNEAFAAMGVLYRFRARVRAWPWGHAPWPWRVRIGLLVGIGAYCAARGYLRDRSA